MENFKNKLSDLKDKINSELLSLFDKQKPEVLYEPMKYAVNIGGKRLRPILCELVYNTFAEEKRVTLYPALAVELLHNFTLVHDDIMDNDDKRRGQETVHKKWDLATGVLSGDGVLSLAYSVLLKEKFNRSEKIMEIFTKGLLEVCEGQGFDKEFETRNDVTEEEYINMIFKKTAALLMVPSQIGAACADANDDIIEIAGEYAKAVGIAFQIQDDFLDIAGNEELLGKTYGSDIQEGKKTFLYIKAMNKLEGDDRKRYIEIIEQSGASREEILEVKDIYDRNGILKDCKNEVEARIEYARSMLTKIPEEYDIADLKNFTDFLLNRKY